MSKQTLSKRLVLGFGLIGLVGLLSSPVLGQDYTIDVYNEFQEAVAEGEDALIGFIKDHPESSLVEYAVGEYLNKLKAYVENGQHQEAVAAGEKFLAGVDGERFDVLYLTTWSAYFSQQYDKAIKYGEQVHAQNAEAPQINMILSRSYLSTGNKEKAVQFGEKYCAEVSPNECYDLLPAIAKYYLEKKDWDKAAQYAKLTVEGLDSVTKPDQVPAQEWTSFTNEEKSIAHTIIGRHAFNSKNFPVAERHFTQAQKLTPSNKARLSEGYYYIGMSRWSQEQIDPAMAAFAKGSQIPGSDFASACRDQLDKLYKATHNGALYGIDEFLAKNKP